MTNEVYDYLKNYFDKTTNASERQIQKVNSYFKNFDRFQKQGLLSDSQKDLLIEDMAKCMYYVIQVISECPNLEIHLKRVIKNKASSSRRNAKKEEINAIGFEYEPDEEEIQCAEYCAEAIDNT